MKSYKYCRNCFTKNNIENTECSGCGCQLEDRIFKNNIILSFIVSIIIFSIVLLICKYFFKSIDVSMKPIENGYLVAMYLIILILSNNYINKPKNSLTALILAFWGLFLFINPPDIVGVTNHDFRSLLVTSSSKRRKSNIALSDSKSYASVAIDIGIIALLMLIWSFITIPTTAVIQPVLIVIIITLLCILPLILTLFIKTNIKKN